MTTFLDQCLEAAIALLDRPGHAATRMVAFMRVRRAFVELYAAQVWGGSASVEKRRARLLRCCGLGPDAGLGVITREHLGRLESARVRALSSDEDLRREERELQRRSFLARFEAVAARPSSTADEGGLSRKDELLELGLTAPGEDWIPRRVALRWRVAEVTHLDDERARRWLRNTGFVNRRNRASAKKVRSHIMRCAKTGVGFPPPDVMRIDWAPMVTAAS